MKRDHKKSGKVDSKMSTKAAAQKPAGSKPANSGTARGTAEKSAKTTASTPVAKGGAKSKKAAKPAKESASRPAVKIVAAKSAGGKSAAKPGTKKPAAGKSTATMTPAGSGSTGGSHKAVKKSVVSASSASAAVQSPKSGKGPAVAKAVNKTTVGNKSGGPSKPGNAAVVKSAKAGNANGATSKTHERKAVKKPTPPPAPPTNPKVIKKIRELQSDREHRKDLALDVVHGGPTAQEAMKDRIVLIVRDSYWLQATWDVTRRSVERVKAAMAENWHTARPILRLLNIDNSGTTNNAETIDRDIEIHGGVRNWYIDVSKPPASFRILLGYIANGERFHELARSNVVTTPIPGGPEIAEGHWADISRDAERVFALSGGYNDVRGIEELQDVFEENLKRPMGSPALAQFGSGAEAGLRKHRNFHFDLDAEMIVFGSTHPQAYVTLGGEPVKVQSDGTFSVRVPLPDKRQVLPATACTRDGVNEQTIVIAVERNTKVMEAQLHDNNDDQ